MEPKGGFVVNIGAACMLHGYADPTFGLLHGDDTIGALLLDKQTKPDLFSGYPVTRSNVQLLTGNLPFYGWNLSLIKPRYSKEDNYACSV